MIFFCAEYWSNYYWVAGTDYETYSILRTCPNGGNEHCKYCVVVRIHNTSCLTTSKVYVKCQDYISSMIDERMSMVHSCNDINRLEPEYSKTNLSWCHFVEDKSQLDWPETETGHPR